MKNLLVYYFAILLPIPIMVWSAFSNHAQLFTFLLLFYAFVYRGFTDSIRLVEKGLIKKNEAWKIFVNPFFRRNFFKQLYFKK